MGLAGGPAGCGEVARSGCSFVWNLVRQGQLYLRKVEIRH
jgi:hypothetical protein